MNGPRILGVIPARGGSKGFPRKNLALLGGKPLIYYTIQAASRSARLTRTVFSSEDPEIIEVSKRLGADVPFTRPGNLASDSATSAAVAKHAVEVVESQEGEGYDYVCLLEPTCPLRNYDDIDAAIELLLETQADAVVSVFRIESPHPVKALTISNGILKPLLKDRWRHDLMRQGLEPVYAVNGALYCVKRNILIRTNSLWSSSTIPFTMPQERSVNIDTPLDLNFAEFLLIKNRNNLLRCNEN